METLEKAKFFMLNTLESMGKALNFKRKFNNWLLNYVRENYDKNLDYVSTLYHKWWKSILEAFSFIVLNGTLWWAALLGLMNIIPSANRIFRIGPGYFHILSILSIGMVLFVFKEIYVWLRKGYKGGTK